MTGDILSGFKTGASISSESSESFWSNVNIFSNRLSNIFSNRIAVLKTLQIIVDNNLNVSSYILRLVLNDSFYNNLDISPRQRFKILYDTIF